MGILDALARRRAEQRIQRRAKRLWSPPKADRTIERLEKTAERTAEKAMVTSMTLHQKFLMRKDEGKRIVKRKAEEFLFGKDAVLKRSTRELLYGKSTRRRRRRR